MTKTTIAIDIDDVIADGTGFTIDSVNKRHSLELTATDYHSVGGEFWGYYERVWQQHAAGSKIIMADVNEEFRRDQSAVPLLPGAEFALGELAKRFRIVFITARPVEWEDATRRWFKKYFGDKDIDLYFAGSHDGTMALTKGQQAVKLGAKLLIDDNPRNCQTAVDEGLQAVLFGDYGWHSVAPSSLKRCKDWPEVLEFLDGTEL